MEDVTVSFDSETSVSLGVRLSLRSWRWLRRVRDHRL